MRVSKDIPICPIHNKSPATLFGSFSCGTEMKRKRDNPLINDPQVCDLVLTDAKGRSLLVHRALLIDKSEYFARLLTENNVSKIQLNENYLVELIDYLYKYDSDSESSYELGPVEDVSDDDQCLVSRNEKAVSDPSVDHGDIEILLQMLVLAKKYQFDELYRRLKVEIIVRLGSSTVLTVYKCAAQLNIDDLMKSARIMILSLLPELYVKEEFVSLSEELFDNLFNSEALDIDSESKLNALSSWWSHNKRADKTELWAKLVNSAYGSPET